VLAFWRWIEKNEGMRGTPDKQLALLSSLSTEDLRVIRSDGLCYAGHVLMENRSGLLVDADLTAATGFAERDCAIEMLARLPASKRRRTVAGDKGYDTKGFVADARAAGFTPHVAQNTTNALFPLRQPLRSSSRHGTGLAPPSDEPS